MPTQILSAFPAASLDLRSRHVACELPDRELYVDTSNSRNQRLSDIGRPSPRSGGRQNVPKGSKIFHYTWVNKAKRGVYKSRFACADVRRGYAAKEEQDFKVFVPTPTPEAHSLLEVRALQHGQVMRTFDIVAAFLIGKDRGAQTGEYVYMRAPPEWKPIYEEWVRVLPPA